MSAYVTMTDAPSTDVTMTDAPPGAPSGYFDAASTKDLDACISMVDGIFPMEDVNDKPPPGDMPRLPPGGEVLGDCMGDLRITPTVSGLPLGPPPTLTRSTPYVIPANQVGRATYTSPTAAGATAFRPGLSGHGFPAPLYSPRVTSNCWDDGVDTLASLLNERPPAPKPSGNTTGALSLVVFLLTVIVFFVS